jgi:hypothetical protein
VPVAKNAHLLRLTDGASADSIGLSLTDTLDDLINDGRIEPQLAMKILANFDRAITEVLADKVKARLNFKVHGHLVSFWADMSKLLANTGSQQRATSILTASATKSGPS